MKRYDDPEDAIPHELTVLVLNQTDECFGRDPADLFEAVRAKLSCDRLLVEEHYRTLAELPEYRSLIQYPIWIVHHSCLFVERTTQLGSYLRSGSFPDETQVVVLLDTEDQRMSDHMRGELASEYSDELTVVGSEKALVHYLLGFLDVANPCTAAGLDYLVSWNNKISDRVGPR